MKLTIESTGVLTFVNGVPVRLWEGRTAGGRRVKVFVHLLATADPEADRELAAELAEQAEPPEARDRAIPMRMIL